MCGRASERGGKCGVGYCKDIVVYGKWVCLIILTPCLSYIFVFAVEGMCIDFIWRVGVLVLLRSHDFEG